MNNSPIPNLRYDYQFPDKMELKVRFDIMAKYEKIRFPVYSDVIIKASYDNLPNGKLDITERQTINLPYSGTFTIEHYQDNTICVGTMDNLGITYSENELIYDYMDMLHRIENLSMKVTLTVLNTMIDYLYKLDSKLHK